MRCTFIIFLLIISFQSSAQEESENLLLDKLNGRWGLINYFDSTLIDRSIFKHSNIPSSYASTLRFDKAEESECVFLGYHEGGPIPILEIEDRYIKVGYDWNQYVELILVNDSTLAFNEYVSSEKDNLRADNETYYFRKLTEEFANWQKYFSKIIIGNYMDSGNNQILFEEGFKVSGIRNFTSYKLLIDIGEVTIGNFDSIQLIDDISKESIWMKWEFVKGKLILTDLDRFIDEQSGMYKYKPSNKKIILTKN